MKQREEQGHQESRLSEEQIVEVLEEAEAGI